MWTLDVGIPARSTVEDTMKMRDQITKKFGAALYSSTAWGFVEFQMRYADKIEALKAKLGVKAFLQQKGFEVVDGEVSTGEAYVICQPEKELI